MKSTFDRLLLYKNPDATIITTPTGGVVYWNNGAESILGFMWSNAPRQSSLNIVVTGDPLIS